MSNHFRLLAVLLTSLLLAGPAAATAGAAPGGTQAAASPTAPTEARLGGSRGGFGRRSPGFGRSRRAVPRRTTARPFRGVGRAILQALGLAFLFHMLFGWGVGGSPLGLLLLLGIVLLMVSRMRRRSSYGPYGPRAYGRF
jgi:hypothetical protein